MDDMIAKSWTREDHFNLQKLLDLLESKPLNPQSLSDTTAKLASGENTTGKLASGERYFSLSVSQSSLTDSVYA